MLSAERQQFILWLIWFDVFCVCAQYNKFIISHFACTENICCFLLTQKSSQYDQTHTLSCLLAKKNPLKTRVPHQFEMGDKDILFSMRTGVCKEKSETSTKNNFFYWFRYLFIYLSVVQSHALYISFRLSMYSYYLYHCCCVSHQNWWVPIQSTIPQI